jgi:Na+-driven multidrug efflux pump
VLVKAAFLRGMRQLNYMAMSSLLGSISGLIISVPIYYFFGINGIVPAIVTKLCFLFFIVLLLFKKGRNCCSEN